jgi:hypothetical protein
MPEAECFMYFIAGLRQLFGDSESLYIEGTGFDPEVEAWLKEQSIAGPKVTPLLRHPKSRHYLIPLSSAQHRELSRFAACKTYAETAEALLVLSGEKVLMDGRRLGERIVLVSGGVSEAKLKKFCMGKLHASYLWVEEGAQLL